MNLPPLRKTIHVKTAPARAFELFTSRMEAWWPFETLSMYHGEKARLDPPNGPGARIVEHARDGRSCPWGEVRVWSPPERLVFSFGEYYGPDHITEVEVTFVAAAGGTQVTLEHRGWERLGDEARRAFEGYDTGWDLAFVERFGGYARNQEDQP
jgi:uncharacterized protein YndB with AHSA1/START domain